MGQANDTHDDLAAWWESTAETTDETIERLYANQYGNAWKLRNAASDKQIRFIARLASERGVDTPGEFQGAIIEKLGLNKPQ